MTLLEFSETLCRTRWLFLWLLKKGISCYVKQYEHDYLMKLVTPKLAKVAQILCKKIVLRQ